MLHDSQRRENLCERLELEYVVSANMGARELHVVRKEQADPAKLVFREAMPGT